MVEIHVDDVYSYDDNISTLMQLGTFGRNTCIRFTDGHKPKTIFGKNKEIFWSFQLNESRWIVDRETTLQTKDLGTGLMVSAMVSRANGFRVEGTYNQLLE